MVETNFSDPFLQRLVAGDRAAFAEMVDQTSGKVYNLAFRMLNDEQDAEDVLQETYLKALKALPNFEGRSSISTWLFRIAANEALMVLRKRKKGSQVVEMDEKQDEDEGTMEIVDWCCLPEKELLSGESKTRLKQAIKRLSAPLKLVFLLRDVEGFSGQETADILGIQENAVKTRLVRARLKLREDLSHYFKERITSGS